jgi:putative N6-adenine-specific DNA methylase
MIKELIGDTSPAELASKTLLDPMMGSGTLLSEARALWMPNFARNYAFYQWKKCPKIFLSESFAFNYSLPTAIPFAKFKGQDIQEEMVTVAKKNLSSLEEFIQKIQKGKFQPASFELKQANSLEASEKLENLWILVNPPYGERLEKAAHKGLSEVAKTLCKNFAPEKIGILYADKERVQSAPQGYRLEKEIKVNNGGIRCLFTILRKN